jgi:hypothetical protein
LPEQPGAHDLCTPDLKHGHDVITWNTNHTLQTLNKHISQGFILKVKKNALLAEQWSFCATYNILIKK